MRRFSHTGGPVLSQGGNLATQNRQPHMPSEPCVHCLQPGQLSTMPPSGDEATQNISHESANIGAPPSGDSAQFKESLQLNNMGTSLSEDVCKLETVPGIVAFNPVSCNTLRTSIIKYKCNTCSKKL